MICLRRVPSALVPSLCSLVFVAAPFVHAQQTQASLTGMIQDNTGSAVPNAQVEITNTDTNISRKVESDSAGRYLVSNLNPGKYSLRVTMQGFSQKSLSGIVLNVGGQDSLDVKLDVGAVTDVVDVQAEASVTATESASQGSVINNQQVVGLPLNTRSFYGLALLSPAAYLPAQNSTLGFRGGFNVAGNNETANTFTVNGIDDNDQNVMAPELPAFGGRHPGVQAADRHLFRRVWGARRAARWSW